MNTHPDKTTEIDRIDVSNHARMRFTMRVDPSDPYPAERIRELIARAEPDADHDCVSNAIAFATDEAIVVADKALETVTTVLRPGGA
jgi:hypothetical protein